MCVSLRQFIGGSRGIEPARAPARARLPFHRSAFSGGLISGLWLADESGCGHGKSVYTPGYHVHPRAASTAIAALRRPIGVQNWRRLVASAGGMGWRFRPYSRTLLSSAAAYISADRGARWGRGGIRRQRSWGASAALGKSLQRLPVLGRSAAVVGAKKAISPLHCSFILSRQPSPVWPLMVAAAVQILLPWNLLPAV